MTVRAELRGLVGPDPTPGQAEPVHDPNHSRHVFLYVPDLSSQTGWASHGVPMAETRGRGGRPVGFMHPRDYEEVRAFLPKDGEGRYTR